MEKNLARHDDSLGLGDIFRGAAGLMKKTGLISLILPIHKEVQALELTREHKLYCSRLTRVKPAPGKALKRVLLEFTKKPGDCREEELIIETGLRHSYSDAYKKLVKEFYLGDGDW
jgi:tRNA1Val (adenine37-N6)-methyltransferase